MEARAVSRLQQLHPRKQADQLKVTVRDTACLRKTSIAAAILPIVSFGPLLLHSENISIFASAFGNPIHVANVYSLSAPLKWSLSFSLFGSHVMHDDLFSCVLLVRWQMFQGLSHGQTSWSHDTGVSLRLQQKIFVHIPHPQCPKTHPTGAFRDERRFKPYKVLIDFVQGKNLVASKVLQMSSSSSSCSCYACPQPRHSPPPGVASKRTSDTWKKISQTNRVSRWRYTRSLFTCQYYLTCYLFIFIIFFWGSSSFP